MLSLFTLRKAIARRGRFHRSMKNERARSRIIGK